MILVTGGAGFIGSHVCQALIDKGEKVICVDNFCDYYDPDIKRDNIKDLLIKDAFILKEVDILDTKALRDIFKQHKVTKVVHLAARGGVRPSIEEPKLYEEVNIRGTLNLLELAREFPVDKFVFSSSSSVYGRNKKVPFSEEDRVDDQVSPYAFTKRAAELLCRTYHNLYKINIVCLRFFTVYGPRGRPDMAVYKFTKRINEGKEIQIYGDGSSSRDYTYIADIVDGILAAVQADVNFEIINLGDSNPIKLSYVISLIEKNIGKKAVIKQVGKQKGDVDTTFADISKAARILGYKPKISIEDGIRLFVKHYLKTK